MAAEPGFLLSRAARSLSRVVPAHAGRVCARSLSSSSTLRVAPRDHHVARESSARSLTGLANDAAANIVGLQIGSAAGVYPVPVPSPLLDPFAAAPTPMEPSAAPAAARVKVDSVDTISGVRTPAQLRAAAASRGKVEEEEAETAASSAPSSSAPTYARPTHPYRFTAHVPPKYARKEFADLFGGADKKAIASGMSMITVALRSRHDMATWSTEIVEEREVLMKEFHDLAARVVENLRAAGHWADYVDPATGKAHHAASSSGSFVETDDRLSQYGYRILDYGCCKAVSHPEWGTHVMVGAVFTDAPHEIVKRLAAVVSSDSPKMAPFVSHATSSTAAGVGAACAATPTPSK